MKKNRNKSQSEHKSVRSKEHEFFVFMRLFAFALFFCALIIFSGCNSGQRLAELRKEIDELKSENSGLMSEVEQLKAENEDLKKRITILQDLPDDVKGINLYKLVEVKIQNYSGLFGENENGEPNTLIVRVQPIDNYGDIIKAAGSVEVELWNLNKPGDQALIGKWQVGVEQLKKDWTSFLITGYKLSFDVAGKIEKFDEPLTIKMNFTDYLSGKVFQRQKVIEP